MNMEEPMFTELFAQAMDDIESPFRKPTAAGRLRDEIDDLRRRMRSQQRERDKQRAISKTWPADSRRPA